MPARRLLMRKIREILPLKHEPCAIGVGTVSLYIVRGCLLK